MKGPIIASLFVLACIAIPIIKLLSWRAEWKGARILGGVLVRFTGVVGADAYAPNIARANAVIADYIQKLYPRHPEYLEYRVDVVPDGTMPNDFGTVIVERANLFASRTFIAKVEVKDVCYLIAHEVARHILPYRIEGTMDNVGGADGYGHTLTRYAAIELEMKRRLKLAGVVAS